MNKEYKNSKWFITAFIVGCIISGISLENASYEDVGVLIIPIITIGILLTWPVDYLVHRKTVKEIQYRPAQVDPHFNRKLLLIAGIIVLIAIVAFVRNTLKQLK